MDLVGVADGGTNEALEPVVAVEASAPLPHLHQPRPHRLGRRLDRDRVRLLFPVRNKLVASE
jgi:hypothetical protein